MRVCETAFRDMHMIVSRIKHASQIMQDNQGDLKENQLLHFKGKTLSIEIAKKHKI